MNNYDEFMRKLYLKAYEIKNEFSKLSETDQEKVKETLSKLVPIEIINFLLQSQQNHF